MNARAVRALYVNLKSVATRVTVTALAGTVAAWQCSQWKREDVKDMVVACWPAWRPDQRKSCHTWRYEHPDAIITY